MGGPYIGCLCNLVILPSDNDSSSGIATHPSVIEEAKTLGKQAQMRVMFLLLYSFNQTFNDALCIHIQQECIRMAT